MSKNKCGKTRDIKKPYEIWLGANGFEWRVLKKYQNPENEAKNEYARWFCAVKSNLNFSCSLSFKIILSSLDFL